MSKIVFSFLLFTSQFVFADNWTSPPQGTLGMKIGFATPALAFEISDPKNGDVKKLKYRPNSPTSAFTSFSYGPFGVSLASMIPQKDEQTRFYGISQYQDYQFRFYGKKGTYDFFYQNYEGYYLENSQDADPSITNSDPRIQRPDIHSHHYGIQYFYSFNSENYSMGASFDHSQWQSKSGGTWLAILGLSQNQIDAQSSLIPAQLSGQYEEFENFRGGQFLTAKVGIGYGYNYIYEHYYFGALLVIALGSQNQTMKMLDQETTHNRPTSGGNLKLGFGHNGPEYFYGIQALFDNNNVFINNIQTTFSTVQSSLFWGTRFENVNIKFLDDLENWWFNK